MAYSYLLDLHQLIDQSLAEAGQAVKNNANDPGEKRFHEGRIEVLSAFKDYLTEKLNPKLPRRIKASYFGMQ